MQADGLIRSPEDAPGAGAPPAGTPSPSEVTTAMVHLYRAEVQRATVWRQRVDTTTNWAVVTSAAAISIAFSNPESHHGLIMLNNLLITAFLFMEAYRFRYYQVWSSRARLIEVNYFAEMLSPSNAPRTNWKEIISQDLLRPRFTISFGEAILRRLGRSYVWIYLLLFLAWMLKLVLFPEPTSSMIIALQRAGVLAIPGAVIAAVYLAIVMGILLAFLLTVRSYGMFSETTPQVILPTAADENAQPQRPG